MATSTPKASTCSAKSTNSKVSKDDAIENYEKSLTLWNDADPGIAEVEDTKKRVAGLKNQ